MVLPFWNVIGGVALRRHRVKYETQFAALLPGRDAVQADVELGAVGGVGELGMGVRHAEGIGGRHLGTLEASFQSLALCWQTKNNSG